MHSFKLEATRVSPLAAVSFVKTLLVWVVFQAPLEVSVVATGAAGTIGVKVDDAVKPAWSVTRYVTAVWVPGVIFASAAKVTTPLEIVQVPWFATVKLPEVMQLLVLAGFTIQLDVSEADP